MGHFLESWLQESKKPRLKPLTFQSYAELVRLHLSPGLGRIPFAKLTPRDVERLINQKLADGLSPRRVQYIHAVLRSALGQAEKWGLVARNVAKLVDAPKVTQFEVKPFTPEQARQFLLVIQGDRLEALYTTAIALGLRQGEVLGLSWGDVNLDTRKIDVRTTLQRFEGEYHLIEPKSARSRRILVLPEIVVEALRVR